MGHSKFCPCSGLNMEIGVLERPESDGVVYVEVVRERTRGRCRSLVVSHVWRLPKERAGLVGVSSEVPT